MNKNLSSEVMRSVKKLNEAFEFISDRGANGPFIRVIKEYLKYSEEDEDFIEPEEPDIEDNPIVLDEDDIAEGLTLVDLAVNFIIDNLGGVEGDNGSYYAIDSYTNMYTGIEERVSAHLHNFTEEQVSRIDRLLS